MGARETRRSEAWRGAQAFNAWGVHDDRRSRSPSSALAWPAPRPGARDARRAARGHPDGALRDDRGALTALAVLRAAARRADRRAAPRCGAPASGGLSRRDRRQVDRPARGVVRHGGLRAPRGHGRRTSPVRSAWQIISPWRNALPLGSPRLRVAPDLRYAERGARHVRHLPPQSRDRSAPTSSSCSTTSRGSPGWSSRASGATPRCARARRSSGRSSGSSSLGVLAGGIAHDFNNFAGDDARRL